MAIRQLEEEARVIFKEAHDALNERKYERIFGNFFPRNGGLLLTQLEHLVTLLRGLTHTVKKPTSLLALDRTRPDIEAYVTQIDRAFEEIEGALHRKRRAAEEGNTQQIRRQIMLKVLALIPPDKPHMRQWLNYHTFLNYLYRIDNLLTDAIGRIT